MINQAYYSFLALLDDFASTGDRKPRKLIQILRTTLCASLPIADL